MVGDTAITGVGIRSGLLGVLDRFHHVPGLCGPVQLAADDPGAMATFDLRGITLLALAAALVLLVLIRIPIALAAAVRRAVFRDSKSPASPFADIMGAGIAALVWLLGVELFFETGRFPTV